MTSFYQKETAMKINVTSRHFKAHQSIVEYAEQAAAKLDHFYDGIIKCDFILIYEKPRNSLKVAELKVAVYGTILTSVTKSDDFPKSIDMAVEKVLVQLKKYKAKLRSRDRNLVRTATAKV